MGLNTKIEYADSTWNPVRGCKKISEGCLNCFAEVWAKRYGHDFSKIVRAADNTFYAPLKWKEPQVILVCDLGDLFHESVRISEQLDVINLMLLSPQHTFLLLTKRPYNMSKFFKTFMKIKGKEKLLNNIWLGVSVENQKAADERIPELLKIPHFKKWLSVEPLLEEVTIRPYVDQIDWVVVGGENAPKARYMQPEWALQIKNQCEYEIVPFFFKQMTNRAEIPKDLQVRQYPKEMKGVE
jgi:protein gp37